jgi:UDP-N-acetylglucosamine 2-epimerase
LTNADTHGRAIIKKIKEFVHNFPEKSRLFASLGQLKYLSLLKHASLMVGNSSSGLIEAPSFKLPVVNIGDRQRGRIRGPNVIDVQECRKESIVKAINKALSPDFKKSLKKMENPYGKPGSSIRIVEKIKTVSLQENLLKKKFYEILH